MHIRLEQPPKNIKAKLPNDEEIRVYYGTVNK